MANRECAAGLLCEGDVCVSALAEGAACDTYESLCDTGLYCYQGVCSAEWGEDFDYCDCPPY